MPKFQDAAEFAAAIAPVIDAAHVNVHASAHRAVTELAARSGVTPGLLHDLRFTLPLRPLTRASLAVVHRYGAAADRERAVQDHLREGTLAEDADGTLTLTPKGLDHVHGLYALHAAAADRAWAGRDADGLAELVGTVLDLAERLPGGALEFVAPPYEPEGAPPGLLLFNRLAALRYHRADAHAAAWQEAGLTAEEIVALTDGPVRARVEAATNDLAAQPYRRLAERDRERLYDGLLTLI